jgi:tetratricopeptide (TPR) repeat protein
MNDTSSNSTNESQGVKKGPPPLPKSNLTGSNPPPSLPPAFPQYPPIPRYEVPFGQPQKQRSPAFGKFAAAALLNLNGFGLGHFWLGNKIHGLVEIAGTVIILAASIFLQNTENVVLWLSLLAGWVIFHAILGGLKANNPESNFGIQPTVGILILIGVGVFVIEGGLFAAMRAVGGSSERAGAVSYRQQDYKKAASQYGLAEVMYKLTYSKEAGTADYYNEVSRLVVDIQKLISAEKYTDVAEKVETLIQKEPGLIVTGHNLGLQAAMAIAAQQTGVGDFAKAADTYSYALNHYSRAKDYAAAQNAFYDELLAWAAKLASEENYEDALVVYKRVQNELPILVTWSEFVPLVGKTYIDFSSQLSDSEQYQDAIDKLEEFQASYPSSTLEGTIRNKYPDLYLELARQQLKNKDYANAVSNYEYLMSAYSTTAQSSVAFKEIVDAYVGYGDSLAESGNNQGAYDIYKKALAANISESDRARVTLALGKILLNIGKDQIAQKLYLQAELSLKEAEGYAQDETLKQEIADAIVLAISSLAGDSGEQGSGVIYETVTSACAGQAATSDAVAYFTDRAGKARSCSGETLPSSITAQVPGELKYVVTYSYGTSNTGSCPYTIISGGGGSATLYLSRRTETVTVRLAKTGAVYSTKTFSGGSPGSCPYYHYFSYSRVDYQYGSSVSEAEVSNWLTSIIK